MKLSRVICLVSILISISVPVGNALDSKSAAPYTKEALQRLIEANKAMLLEPKPDPKTKAEAAGAVVKNLTKLYSKAGYSFDKTIIALAEHIKNAGGIEEGGAKLSIAYREPFLLPMKYASDLIEINKQESLKPYMTPEAYKALLRISDMTEEREKEKRQNDQAEQARVEEEKAKELEKAKTRELELAKQREEEQKQKEAAALLEQERRAEEIRLKQKQEAEAIARKVGRFVGNYYFQNANGEGTIDVYSASETSVTFGISCKRYQGGTCKLESKTAEIVDPGALRSALSSVHAKYSFKEGTLCEVDLEFDRPKLGQISVFQKGSGSTCKNYCSAIYAGIRTQMGGTYSKLSDKPNETSAKTNATPKTDDVTKSNDAEKSPDPAIEFGRKMLEGIFPSR